MEPWTPHFLLHLNQMIAELCLHRSHNNCDRRDGSFAKDCITQSYESDNEYTYLDQIRICNKQWHHPPFFRLDGDAPSKYGGVGRLLCVPDFP